MPNKTLIATSTVGIIAAGVLGASIGQPVEEPVREPVVINPVLVETEQASSLSRTGEYIQVTRDGRALNKQGEVTSDLLNKMTRDEEIHVYEAPCGKGYQVITYTSTSTISKGYGCKAESRTYIIERNYVASSTEKSL